MYKQSINPLSKPFLNECLGEMSEMQRVLMPLLSEYCPTDGCIRCLGLEGQYDSDVQANELCEKARHLQQYMACAIASIYRLNTSTSLNYRKMEEQSRSIKEEYEELTTLLKTIKSELITLQPYAKIRNGQFNAHVSSMLELLQDIPNDESDIDVLTLIELHFPRE